jgi:hypothetical protein
MTEAEHHQIELEQQEQALNAVSEQVRQAVLDLPFDKKIGLVSEMFNNEFIVVTFDMRTYVVKIEEK